MAKRVFNCPNTPIAELAKLMRAHDIGCIPIGEDDKLVGMVTDREVANRTAQSSNTIEIACDFAKPNGSAAVGTDFGFARCRGHFSTSHDSVRLDSSGIVVLSSGAVEASRPRILRTHSLAALEEMHSRIKLTIAAAVGRRGKWRR
jgi:CBS domain